MSKRSFKGFAVPGKIYKLKTMATNRKKPIVFHAEALADKSRQLLLEGQESISILPFDCDETFINVTVTDAGPTERTGKFVFGYMLGESSGCRALFQVYCLESSPLMCCFSVAPDAQTQSIFLDLGIS